MLVKTLTADVKDVDEKGQVKFQFSQFDFIDSDKDITYSGAFVKTMQENRKRIKHFKNHIRNQTPGVIKDLYETKEGAFAVTQLILGDGTKGDPGTTLAWDTYSEYKAGAITEHSYGYDIIKADPRTTINGIEGVQGLRELKLDEVTSLNAWGASEMTPTLDVKNLKESDLDSVVSLLKKLESLKKGDFSDEYFAKLENKIAAVQKYLTSLREPPVHSLEPVEYILQHSKMFN